MIPLPAAIIAVVAAFAPWVLAARLEPCPGIRGGGSECSVRAPALAAVRRIMGLGQARRLARYHRVLRRARGSGLQAAKILLGLLIRLLPAQGVPMVGVDETGERRPGKKLRAKGCYRDVVRSTQKPVVSLSLRDGYHQEQETSV